MSIVIPAYNESKTIVKTLESAYNLNYPRAKMEIIVVNDGSSDGTLEIITQYIKDKPNFRVLSHQNIGKAASLNKALDVLRGEFFACLDADSFVERHTLRRMLSLYYQNNDPHLAIVTPAMKVSAPSNILQKVQWLEYIVITLISRISSHLDALYVAPGPFHCIEPQSYAQLEVLMKKILLKIRKSPIGFRNIIIALPNAAMVMSLPLRQLH